MKKNYTLRRVVSLFFLVLLTTISINAQHYTPPTSNNGSGQWQLFAGGVTLDGVDMVAGDEIGIFDGNDCVGSFVLTQVCTEGNYVQNEFYAYEENGDATVGYTADNSFSFKLWDNSASTEYDIFVITYMPGGQYSDASNFPGHNVYVWSQMKFAFSSGTGNSVSGTITDENGDAYEGATVIITNEVTDWTTTSASDGTYTLMGIPDNAGTVYTFKVEDASGYKDYASAQFAITEDITDKDHQLEVLDGTFYGSVQDQYGNLVAGAMVSVNTTPATEFTTLNDGNYSIDVPAGTYTITASKTGYSNDTETGIEVTSGQSINTNFQLDALPGGIDGYVKFMDGANEIGANGVMISLNGTELYTYSTDDGSGNPGYFSFDDVNVGYHNLTITSPVFNTQNVSSIVVESDATTTVDDIMLSDMSSYYNFTSGDPDAPVWTIYLKTVEDAGNYELKAGDEIAIYTHHPIPAQRVLVGVHQVTGPIDGSSATANPVLAFSKLSDGTTGFTNSDVLSIDVHIAGGSTTTLDNGTETTWTADNAGDQFDYDPSDNSYYFTTDDYMYSIVDIDFTADNGDFIVNLVDENGDDLSVTDAVSLTLNTTPTTTINATGPAHTFSDVAAGTYSLTISGNQFKTKTITGINIAYAQDLEKTYTLNHADSETQTIKLHSGINIISRRVGDLSGTMLDYMDDSFEDNLDVVSNEDAVVLQKIVGTGWNTPDYSWQIDRGYKVLMNTADELYITGIPIAYNTPITIDANTNFISYYPDYTLDAEAAFASIKDVNALGYVRQWDGKMLRYLSALGEWDNQIGETEPGQGYIVYRSVPGTVDLVYPALPPMMNAKTYFNNDPVHFTKPIGNPDAAIFTFYLQGEDLEVGDEVAAFDGDKMVGATRIASLDDITGNPLNMFRGLEDGYNNGYTPGNPISLMIWKASSNKEYRVLYTILNENEQEGDQFAYAGEGFPEGDYKYSLVDITMPLSVNNNLVDFINIYPNPANNMVNINSPVKMDRINIVNLLGQNVIDFTPDSGITEINLSSLDTGVYFINMFIDGNKLTKKLIIQ